MSESDKEAGARVTKKPSKHKLSLRSGQRRTTWTDVPRRLLTYGRCAKRTLGRATCAVRRTEPSRHDVERNMITFEDKFSSYLYIYLFILCIYLFGANTAQLSDASSHSKLKKKILLKVKGFSFSHLHIRLILFL